MPKTLQNVFVIDDDYISLFLITKILKAEQLTENILPFTNGISALNYLSVNALDFYKLPEVILLDIKMPEINGWQFLRELNKINFIEDYKPVIFITSADVTIDVEIIGSFSYVKGHLVKPVMPHKLITLFESLEMEFENNLIEETVQ